LISGDLQTSKLLIGGKFPDLNHADDSQGYYIAWYPWARGSVEQSINQFIEQKDRSTTYIDMHEYM